jgi:hypothetical protein
MDNMRRLKSKLLFCAQGVIIQETFTFSCFTTGKYRLKRWNESELNVGDGRFRLPIADIDP